MVNVKLDNSKVFQLRIANIDNINRPLDGEVKHIMTNLDGIKKLFPRDVDLFIIKACASRMEIGAYFLYKPEHQKQEIECRRIR